MMILEDKWIGDGIGNGHSIGRTARFKETEIRCVTIELIYPPV